MARAEFLNQTHRLTEASGLRHQPFVSSPDCQLAPFGRKRREVLATLYLGVLRNRSLLTLVGANGLGKTLLLHQLAARLHLRARVAFLLSAPRDRCGLLRGALEGFGFAPTREDRVAMRSQLRRFATDEREAGRHTVLIIDDAHSLDASALDEVERLFSLGIEKPDLLQVVLAGPPALTEALRAPGLAAFRRRMTLVPPLEPLSPVDTADYIDYRLWIAGYDATAPLFTPEAVRRVAAVTGGVPRRIDTLCSRALTLGCLRKVMHIDGSIVEEAIACPELDGSQYPPASDTASAVRSVEPLPLAVGQGSMLVFPTLAASASARQDAWPTAEPAPAHATAESAKVPSLASRARRHEPRPVVGDTPHICPLPADNPQLSKLVQSLLATPAPRSVLFTSVDQGAQTARLCADVAKVLAAGTLRVAVVDADRRLSALHAQFGIGSRPGLGEVLDGRLPIEAAMVAVGSTLSVLTFGLVARSGASCLLPEQVADLMGELKSRFDYVLINGMPLNQGSDSLVFGEAAEGVLLVVAAHATQRVAARQARDQLETAGARLLGAVLTGRTFPIPDAIYRRL